MALVTALVVAELVLRLLPGPASSYRFPAVDPQRSWLAPGVRRGDGYPVAWPKQPGVFRVVTVGDSYTWGDGVYPEDTYGARVVGRLAHRMSSELEWLSWSRKGWNTFQELWWFRRELDLLDPDLAILGFCLNDAEPFDAEALAEIQAPLGRLLTSRPETEPGGLLVLQRLWTGIGNLADRRRLRRYYHSLYESGPGWPESQKALRAFSKLTRERSIPFLLVIFPIFDSQLDPRYPYRDLHDTVRRAAEEAGIRVLDLLPYYDGVDARRLAVRPFTDPHPNELAHRIAADVIVDYLVEEGMLQGLAVQEAEARAERGGAR